MRRWLFALSLIMLCLASQRVTGQGIVWEKKVGWLYDDGLVDAIETEPGFLLATGFSQYFSIIQGNLNRSTLTIVKLNTQGDTIWVRPLPITVYGRSALIKGDDSTHNYILCSTDTATVKVHLLKVNLEGHLIDDIPLFGTSGIILSHAFRDSEGAIVAIGSWFAGIGSPNQDDMVVLKINPIVGLPYFVRRYSDHPITYGYWVEETPRHTYLASGVAGSRIWAIELSPNGDEIRRTTFHQSQSRTIYDNAWVVQAPAGRYIASGVLDGSSNIKFYFGSFNGFDSSARLWGGEQPNYALQPHVNSEGSMLLYHSNAGQIHFSRYRADSSVIWDIDISNHSSLSIATLNKLVYLFDSSAIGIGRVLTQGNNQNDYYLCRIRNVGKPYNPAEPTATKSPYRSLPPLIAYPTPATTTLIVHTRAQEPLQLMNLSGQLIRTAKPDQGGTTQIDVAALPPGIYLLRQGQATIKVTKE